MVGHLVYLIAQPDVNLDIRELEFFGKVWVILDHNLNYKEAIHFSVRRPTRGWAFWKPGFGTLENLITGEVHRITEEEHQLLDEACRARLAHDHRKLVDINQSALIQQVVNHLR